MFQYVEKILIPNVRVTWSALADDRPAFVIMDNLRGQITSSVTNLLESNDIHVCLLPPNTTDSLEPMDLSVNKPMKDLLKWCFAIVIAAARGIVLSCDQSILAEFVGYVRLN